MLIMTVILAIASMMICSCSGKKADLSGEICGLYSREALKPSVNGTRPVWLDEPGSNCAVGQGNWGNSSKSQAEKDAIHEAVGFLANEIAGVTARVDSVLVNRKTVSGGSVTSYQQGDYYIEIEGKRVTFKIKKQAIWYDGYLVWVLVEKLN